MRPETSTCRKELVRSVRGMVTGLAQWSAGWGSGYLVPTAVDFRVLGAAVRSCAESVVIRHIVDEMWSAEQNCSFHAGIYPCRMFTFLILLHLLCFWLLYGGVAYSSRDCRVIIDCAV